MRKRPSHFSLPRNGATAESHSVGGMSATGVVETMTSGKTGCCLGSAAGTEPARDRMFLAAAQGVAHAAEPERNILRRGLVPIPGGVFEMGARKSRFPRDLDAPRRKVFVSPFLISPTAVTNAEYARFVAATSYRTVAEQEGWSYVFHLLLADPRRHPVSPPGLHWWRRVDGANWSAPEGPPSGIAGREDHPVVHIAWYDALAYVTWAGLRLAREAEWERAARGGRPRLKFPWGDALQPSGSFAMNTWQGNFPNENTAEDGFLGPAPVTAFSPNPYGLYNMCGNVWEWVNDRFGPLPAASVMPPRDPSGAVSGTTRVQRGGSYLCHDSYCDRHHVHSRTHNDPDSSTGNCGFRVADNA